MGSVKKPLFDLPSGQLSGDMIFDAHLYLAKDGGFFFPVAKIACGFCISPFDLVDGSA